MARVFRELHHDQVCRVVVLSVAVLVMDDLTIGQQPADLVLGQDSVKRVVPLGVRLGVRWGCPAVPVSAAAND
jgi:hypothetical protein